jgi:hypothetical protein
VPAGGEATSFNPLYFSLKMPDNTKVDAELAAVDGQIDSSDVVPGDCVRGRVGFAIPSSTQASALYFQTFTGNPLRWTLPPTSASALAVVEEYFAALNAHNYPKAWELGGKNLAGGSSYEAWVQGFSTTLHVNLTNTSSQGNIVYATVEATQTSGEVRTYQGSYTVSNGVIISASVKQTA